MKKLLSMFLICIVIVVYSQSCFAVTGVSGKVSIGPVSDSEDNEAPIAKKGSKGEDVKSIQERLIELGYLQGKADGDFGKNTKNAVQAFQRDNGLAETGEISKSDYEVLFAPEETATPEPELTPTPKPTPSPTPRPTSYISDDGWCVSDDSVAEVIAVSFTEYNYPEFALSLKYRIDGTTESSIEEYIFDYTPEINEVVASGSSNNRKVKVEMTEGAYSFEYQNSTQYKVRVKTIVGDRESITLVVNVDLSNVFPEEFINYDALNIATCIKKYKTLLLDPSSMTVGEITIRKDIEKSIDYYKFSVSAKNRLGAMTPTNILVCYNTKNGTYDIINEDKGETIYSSVGDSDFMGSGARLNILLSSFSGMEEYTLQYSSVRKYM